MEKKIAAFEYLVFRLLEWQREMKGTDDNDISILKALKLLFFVSAVDTSITEDNTLLDNVFDNFVAMPFGHVESNVYDNIKRGRHRGSLEINNSFARFYPNFTSDLDIADKERIDSSIGKLKLKNENFINLSAFQLVDLSHRWYSWKSYFNKAQLVSSNSIRIPVSIIKNEEKFYSLN